MLFRYTRPALAAVAVLLVVALPACAGRSRSHRGNGPAAPQNIPVATAAPATVKPTIQIAGIIAPYQNVSISSSLSEPTARVTVVQGDRVRAGQTLAVLDASDLQASYNADERNAISADAKAAQAKYQAQYNLGQGTNQVDSARATLVQAQAALRQAQSDLVRYQDLLKGGYISPQQVQQQATLVRNDQGQADSAVASLQTAILNAKVNGTNSQGLQASTVASAIADAQSAHAQADQVAAMLARATVVSPVDGVVVNRNLNPGEYPGSRTIFTVQQLDPVYAELNASSSQVFEITRGSKVSLAVAGVAGASYAGRVSAVLGQVQPGSTNFTVECVAGNPGERLQSGMAVTGTITLPVARGIGIPTAAFLDDSHTSVMVVTSDGTAKEQTVKEQSSDGKTSIVTGLAKGTQIVANGQLGITEGESINEDASPSPGVSGSPAVQNAEGSPNPNASGSPWAGHHHHRHPQPSPSDQP
jgi:HlyD family secretion protein